MWLFQIHGASLDLPTHRPIADRTQQLSAGLRRLGRRNQCSHLRQSVLQHLPPHRLLPVPVGSTRLPVPRLGTK